MEESYHNNKGHIKKDLTSVTTTLLRTTLYTNCFYNHCCDNDETQVGETNERRDFGIHKIKCQKKTLYYCYGDIADAVVFRLLTALLG